jgi:hypothetical protein
MSLTPPNQRGYDRPAPHIFPAMVLCLAALWSRRTWAAVRWCRNEAWRSLQRFLSPKVHTTGAWSASYKDLYRSLGDRALQHGRPGERLPELMLHDLKGNHQPLSRCWKKQPALLVTMSLSCGQTRRHAQALQRLSRRFETDINMVIIYVLEAHPVDTTSPYSNRIWVTTRNEMVGIRCAQPRSLEERIALAHQLKRRFRLSIFMLIDALDDRAWRAFGSAPNVAILVDTDGRIAAKQGWFEPKEMAHVIISLLKNSLAATDHGISRHE